MRFSQSNQLMLSLMIFDIQDLKILVLCYGNVYFLLKLRYLCYCCCMVLWVPGNFLPIKELLINMMLVVLFMVWKLIPLITFLFIAMWLGGSRIVLCNGLGMIGVYRRLFNFFYMNEIICYMGNFNAKPSIHFVVVSCNLFGLSVTN
jgi:hypothetical protein